jgi:hypothetical protein
MLQLALIGIVTVLAAPAPSNPELDPVPVAPGEYTYSPAQRRDPFVGRRTYYADCFSCMRPKNARPSISELALKGIVKTPKGYRAVLEDADGKTHAAVLGDKLDDGEVVAIDAQGVTFRQRIRDPLAPVKVRELRKTLHGVSAAE